jgi:hypothetical protein
LDSSHAVRFNIWGLGWQILVFAWFCKFSQFGSLIGGAIKSCKISQIWIKLLVF